MEQTPDGRRSNGNSKGNTRKVRRKVALGGSDGSSDVKMQWALGCIERAGVACDCGGSCKSDLNMYVGGSRNLVGEIQKLRSTVLGFDSSTGAEIQSRRATELEGMVKYSAGEFQMQFTFGVGKVCICRESWAVISCYPPTQLSKHVKCVLGGQELGSSRTRGLQKAPTGETIAQGGILNDVMIKADVGMDPDQPNKPIHINPESIKHCEWPRYLCDRGIEAGYTGLVKAYHSTDALTAVELYSKLAEYSVPVLCYSGYCKSRKIAIGGGLANPMIGAAPVAGAARQPATTSLIPGVSVRNKTAFSSHDECATCRLNRLGESNSATGLEKRRWQQRKGVHNIAIKRDRMFEQAVMTGGRRWAEDKTARATGEIPSTGTRNHPRFNRIVRGNSFAVSMNICTIFFGERKITACYMIPPWIQCGANLTCTMRYMALEQCRKLGIKVPDHVYFQADGGSDELGSVRCAGFFAHLVWKKKTTSLTQFRLWTKHSHMFEDQIGGGIKTAAKGNKRQFGIWESFTPMQLAEHVEKHLQLSYPGTTVVVEWVLAVHDWEDHQNAMTTFAGLKDSCRKMDFRLGVQPDLAGGIFDSSDDESDDDSNFGAPASVQAVPLGTSYENCSDRKPAGVTFGGSWRVEDTFPIFTREPAFPDKMQPHSVEGLASAIAGIDTCRLIISESDERVAEKYYIQRKAGDARSYDSIKATHLQSLDELWIPSTVNEVPPGWSPQIAGFPDTIRDTNPIAAAEAELLAETPVMPLRMHFGTAAQRPKPIVAPVQGWMAIIICKEDDDHAAEPAVARIISVEDDGLLKLRWYNDPTDKSGKCKHFGYDATQLFGPPHHKIAHCADNLVTASGKYNISVQLSSVGKKWWNLALQLCDSGSARI
jgi:hypothetical protein